ncbi:MAG TPA: sensor histidine kinase [Jiangellaceae bacterium]|nr:sensor histidine kinase [Jiangellaceae bacterium]
MIEQAARVAAPAALALFVIVGAAQSQQPPAVSAAVALVVVVAGLVIAWRRLTGWTLAAALAVPAAGLVVLCYTQPSNLGWFGMCVIAGWAALGAAVRPAVAIGVALIGTFVAQSFVTTDPGWQAWTAGVIFTTMACAFARQQRVLVVRLREAQAGLTERARAEERNRIAGEMHDVIGHALTVSLLHVSSARLALDDDPDEARESLTEAERLARESLDEVRATVGLLRTADSNDVLPMPTGADVPELVESFRRAGSHVELDVRGEPETLGTTRGLAVYRIVQESLTNAARHGDGSPVSVRVDVGRDDITVAVASGGSPLAGTAEGSGLVGMRERAEALGGQLRAGPVPGGWRTEAVLPA